MRCIACIACVSFALGSPALAQLVPPNRNMLPSAADVVARNMYTIGVGAAIVPDYEGSDDYRVIPAGAIRAKISGLSVTTNGPYVYLDLFPKHGSVSLDAGPIAGLRFDSRRHSDDPVVKLMVHRRTADELGGFLGVSLRGLVDPYDSLAVHLDVLHDIGNAYKSTVLDPNVSFSTPLSQRTYVSLSASTEIATHKYADYYFAVTPADVIATSGALPLYNPRHAGMKNWKASVLLSQAITGNLLHGFSVFALGQYSRLLGEFARAPIVSERGSANQWIGALGVAYTL